MDDETVFTYPGAGTPASRARLRGDLVLHIRVSRPRRFQARRAPPALRTPHLVRPAALGGPVELTTLTGERVTFEVPRGSQTHTVVRVPGHGMPDRPGSGRSHEGKGDLLVRLIVETPTKLTPEQEELFRKLAALDGTAPAPQKGLFGKLKDRITGEHPPTE